MLGNDKNAQYIPLHYSGLDEWGGENSVLHQVLAASQQEYLDSLKSKNKEKVIYKEIQRRIIYVFVFHILCTNQTQIAVYLKMSVIYVFNLLWPILRRFMCNLSSY